MKSEAGARAKVKYGSAQRMTRVAKCTTPLRTDESIIWPVTLTHACDVTKCTICLEFNLHA